MRLNVLAVLLFAVQWMTITAAGIGPPANCCNKITNTKIKVTNIVKYVLQDRALCAFKAVRFTTIKHSVICSDPESRWAKFAMCVVDKTKSTSRSEAVSICRNLTLITAPSKPSTTVPSNPFMTATPVSVPSKKTVDTTTTTASEEEKNRIETATTVKSPVADDSLKKSSPNFNRVSAEASSVQEGGESESHKSSDEKESPAGISKTKNTELEESLHAEERETLSSTVNEQSPNKNTVFCF